MPGLENRGGRLKSLLWAQLSLHTQATNLLRTDHRQILTKWGKDPHHYYVRVTIPIEAHHICTCIEKLKNRNGIAELNKTKIDLSMCNMATQEIIHSRLTNASSTCLRILVLYLFKTCL